MSNTLKEISVQLDTLLFPKQLQRSLGYLCFNWQAYPLLLNTSKKCAAVVFRNTHQAEAELEPPDIGSQPDQPINQEEYEPPSYTSQEHTIAEPPEGVCEAHRRVIPLYNYGSIN